MRDLRDHLLDLARIVSVVRDRATGHRRVRLGRLADMLQAAIIEPVPMSASFAMHTRGIRTCYECGDVALWLAPDGRCSCCTRCMPDEVLGFVDEAPGEQRRAGGGHV